MKCGVDVRSFHPWAAPCWRRQHALPLAHMLLLVACPVHALQFGSSGSAGEVYGATGRIGSLLLRSGAGKLAAVPRLSLIHI